MVNFRENYHFSKFRRGSNIFQGGGGGGGGPTFSRGGGGSNCLFPIKPFITCDFLRGGGGGGGGSVPLSPPPLDLHLTHSFSS